MRVDYINSIPLINFRKKPSINNPVKQNEITNNNSRKNIRIFSGAAAFLVLLSAFGANLKLIISPDGDMIALSQNQETDKSDKINSVEVSKESIKDKKKPSNTKRYQEKMQEILFDNELQEKLPQKPKEEAFTITKGEEMAALAETFIDFNEKDVEEKCGYNLPDGLWCAAFVRYIAQEIYGAENMPEWYIKDGCCNKCSDVLEYAKQNNVAFNDYKKAQTGDIVIFNTGGKIASHMGIVTNIEDDILTTIEGNVTNALVAKKTYNLAEKPDIVNSFIRMFEE